MSLFCCSKCKTVENTALSVGWWEHHQCSECRTGKWHGIFKKENAIESGYYKDKDGFIYSPGEVDTEKMIWKYNGTKIVGRVE